MSQNLNTKKYDKYTVMVLLKIKYTLKQKVKCKQQKKSQY